MILIADVFTKLQTAKNRVRQRSKKPRFRTPFGSQRVEGSQTLLESGIEHLYYVFHYSDGN